MAHGHACRMSGRHCESKAHGNIPGEGGRVEGEQPTEGGVLRPARVGPDAQAAFARGPAGREGELARALEREGVGARAPQRVKDDEDALCEKRRRHRRRVRQQGALARCAGGRREHRLRLGVEDTLFARSDALHVWRVVRGPRDRMLSAEGGHHAVGRSEDVCKSMVAAIGRLDIGGEAFLQ